jgi:hypothetical protein
MFIHLYACDMHNYIYIYIYIYIYAATNIHETLHVSTVIHGSY